MGFPMILLKIAAKYWAFSCRKMRWSYVPPVTCRCEEEEEGDNYKIVVSDLLCSPTGPFPYLMLVAFEGGSLLRALVLLVSTPLLCAVGCLLHAQLSIRIMVFITFCGLKVKDMEIVARAVLPKFYLDNLHHPPHKGGGGGGGTRRVVVFSTSLPRVMLEGFLKDFLGVDEVVGTELKLLKGGCYFTGLMSSAGCCCCCCLDFIMHKRFKEHFGPHHVALLATYNNKHHHLFLSHCKEAAAYINVRSSRGGGEEEEEEYLKKALIFHDSRLAFLPTPLSSLALFLFLPLLFPLSVARIFFGVVPPYKLILPIAALTGTRFRVDHDDDHHIYSSSKGGGGGGGGGGGKGVVYVCNHRTLLDPVMLATALQRPIPAVTYSVSPLSEAIAPMRTVRLTRNREADADTMGKLLAEGDLTICPEGTTCREPYLLRFSPLFAEIADKIVPAAMDARGTWFYGTTATGFKSLDPLFFFMNPTPTYRVRLLHHEFTCARGARTASQVANRIQKQIGDALGFECTSFTRKDKYMMLTGNQGPAS